MKKYKSKTFITKVIEESKMPNTYYTPFDGGSIAVDMKDINDTEDRIILLSEILKLKDVIGCSDFNIMIRHCGEELNISPV